MSKSSRLILVYSLVISLILFYIFQRTSIPLLFDLEQVGYDLHNINFFFLVMLIGLLSLSYIKRRKRTRLVLSLFIGLLSYTCWISPALWWYEYNVSFYEQRFLAVILLGIALWVVVSKPSKEKRRQFSEVVRRKAIQKQKGRCNKCRRKLEDFGLDLDHKNGDSSNNKPSNCQVLCVPCHRRKHAR
jgi:peptidoglycan/LPS O-acetylase OafA/YrhL